MEEEKARWACFNAFIFIDATGGTGGGIFRYMYSRFLKEAAEICDNNRLADIGDDLQLIGDMCGPVLFHPGISFDLHVPSVPLKGEFLG